VDACETQGRRGKPRREPGARKQVRKWIGQAFDQRIVTDDSRTDSRGGLENDSSYRYAIARPANATASQQISDRHAATLASPVPTSALGFVAFL
jgi:hypothetical protein